MAVCFSLFYRRASGVECSWASSSSVRDAVGDEHALGGQVPTGVLLLGKGHFLAFLQDLVQRAERQQEAADIFF